jgi:hypothetical protein
LLNKYTLVSGLQWMAGSAQSCTTVLRVC